MENGFQHDKDNEALQALFWRDEILQVLYWMQGENLAQTVALKSMFALLDAPKEVLIFHLKKLVTDGYLLEEGQDEETTYRLSDLGKKEAGKRFSDAFQGLQKAGHGECGPDCEFCYGPGGEKLEDCVHNCAENHTHH